MRTHYACVCACVRVCASVYVYQDTIFYVRVCASVYVYQDTIFYIWFIPRRICREHAAGLAERGDASMWKRVAGLTKQAHGQLIHLCVCVCARARARARVCVLLTMIIVGVTKQAGSAPFGWV